MGDGGRGKGAPGGRAAGPPVRARRGPGLPESPLGAPGRGGGRTGAGTPREGAGRRRHPRARRPPLPSPPLRPPSPPISRLPLSLRPPCPEAGRAPPLPLGRAAGLLPAAVPAAARGAGRGFRREGGRGVRGSFSWRRRGSAGFPQRQPPSPIGKNWLPLTVEPVVRAGASKGVSSPALRWPLRYTSEGFTRTLHTNTGCAPGSCSGEGCVDFFGGLKPGRETGWPTRAPGYNKTPKRIGGRGQWAVVGAWSRGRGVSEVSGESRRGERARLVPTFL